MAFNSRPITFHEPSVIIENISRKVIDIMGLYRLQPGKTVDLYRVSSKLNDIDEPLIRGMIKPNGDLYIESEIKKTIIIHKFIPAAASYAKNIKDDNFDTFNLSFPGAILTVGSDGFLEWTSVGSGLSSEDPIDINGNTISIPVADATTDGYLSKEDWVRFDSAADTSKLNQKIWQYQDFTAPVSSSLTLTAFENGTGLAFNSSYIQNGTAQIVLTSDTSKPPTTTTSVPAKWLPGNRVVVSSHIGTAVTLNQTPAATLDCRVFFLIDVPAAVQLPADYQEDPEFINDASAEFLDENYVNQNQDESIFGEKIFENDSRFNSNVGIGQDPTTPLDVLGKIRTTEFQLTTGAFDGYFLKSNSSGNASWVQNVGASSVMLWGNSNIASTTTTRYLTPGYTDSMSQTNAIQFRVPFTCIAKNMGVRHNTTAGNGNLIAYTLRVGGVASALTVSLASTTISGSDLANTVALVAGDLIDVEVTKAASIGTSPSDIVLSLEIVE